MESHVLGRRRFLGDLLGGVVGSMAGAMLGAGASAGMLRAAGPRAARAPLFGISLAQWSLHRTLRAGKLDNLDFPRQAKAFGIGAVEYVNSFWKDHVRDAKYVADLRRRCDGEGVQSVLIMCDGLGALGDPDAAQRTQAIENHRPWLDAAKALGCHAIRVNAQSRGDHEEQQKLAADGLHRLCEHGERAGIDVIVENHGGLSSNGAWLAGTLRLAKHARCGSLPDFGNFTIGPNESYDRYRGVDELMPFARGVSAKSHDFDEKGNEVHTDFRRMLDIVVVKHGWRGFVGIEYEGEKLPEADGVLATKKLLETVRAELEARLEAASAKKDEPKKEPKKEGR